MKLIKNISTILGEYKMKIFLLLILIFLLSCNDNSINSNIHNDTNNILYAELPTISNLTIYDDIIINIVNELKIIDSMRNHGSDWTYKYNNGHYWIKKYDNNLFLKSEIYTDSVGNIIKNVINCYYKYQYYFDLGEFFNNKLKIKWINMQSSDRYAEINGKYEINDINIKINIDYYSFDENGINIHGNIIILYNNTLIRLIFNTNIITIIINSDDPFQKILTEDDLKIIYFMLT